MSLVISLECRKAGSGSAWRPDQTVPLAKHGLWASIQITGMTWPWGLEIKLMRVLKIQFRLGYWGLASWQVLLLSFCKAASVGLLLSAFESSGHSLFFHVTLSSFYLSRWKAYVTEFIKAYIKLFVRTRNVSLVIPAGRNWALSDCKWRWVRSVLPLYRVLHFTGYTLAVLSISSDRNEQLSESNTMGHFLCFPKVPSYPRAVQENF